MSYSQDDKETIRDILLDHQGKSEAITSRELNEVVKLDSIGSFPATRAAIRELIMEDQIPIGSCSNGYYLIETDEELEENVEQLDNRITATAERRYGLLRASDKWDASEATTLMDFTE